MKTLFYTIAFLLMGALTVLFMSANAHAAENCGRYKETTANLTKKWGERQTGFGMTEGGFVMELWTSAKNNTWTLMRVAVNGDICIIDTGKYWGHVLPKSNVQPKDDGEAM